jgi:hypothetical protein
MKKYVIYTVLTGGYEDILQPLVIDDRFDYFLFTDNVTSEKEGVWSVKPIPDSEGLDKMRLSRYPKSHPVSLLSEYVASLYMDANIQIKDDWIYSRIIELVDNNIEYAGVKLVISGLDCIYDHAFDMCVVGVEHDYNGIEHCHELYKRNFPPHFGLNENNIIFRMHTKSIENADNEWWYWITHYSRRDQFSYMYCLWKNNIPINYILPEGEDSRNSRHFIFVVHNDRPNVAKSKFIKKGINERIRLKALAFDYGYGQRIWSKSYRSEHPLNTFYFLSRIALLRTFILFPWIVIKRVYLHFFARISKN